MYRIIFIFGIVLLLSACFFNDSGDANSEKTFTVSAAAGELIEYSVDLEKLKYSYKVTFSSYGLTGHTESGTLIKNADGSYSPTNDLTSSLFIAQSGLLTGNVNLTLNGSITSVPVIGVTNPVTSLEKLAGTFNYIASTCANSNSGSGCSTTSYGTIQIDANGNYQQCTGGDLATTANCSATGTGIISSFNGGVWKYGETGVSTDNFLVAFKASNNQIVLIIDVNSPNYGYGQAVASTQTFATPNVNDGDYYFTTNISEYGVTTVSGANFTDTHTQSNGNLGTNSGTLQFNTPWDGFGTATGTNGSAISIMAGTGVFVSLSPLSNHYYSIGIRK